MSLRAFSAKQSPSRELEIASSRDPSTPLRFAQDALLAITTRELARAISNLAERGLYMRDAATDTFDLHPVIRRYCYDMLADKQQTHARFRVYFAAFSPPQKIQMLADL